MPASTLNNAVNTFVAAIEQADPLRAGQVGPTMRVGIAPEKSLHNEGPGVLALQSGSRLHGIGNYEYARVKTDYYLRPVLHLLCRDRVDPTLPNELFLNPELFTNDVVKFIQHAFPGLQVRRSSDELNFDFSDLTNEEKTDLQFDIKFFAEHPGINGENICSTLYNYHPDSHSQHELLLAAANFAGGVGKQGLFLQGEGGIGKTHISVAIAKELTKQGATVYLTTGNNNDLLDPVALAAADLVIYDDFNKGTSQSRKTQAIYEHVLKSDTKLFITTNHKSFDRLMFEEVFVTGGEIERMTSYIRPKLKDFFHRLNLDDAVQSHREATVWHLDATLSERQETLPLSLPQIPAITLERELLGEQAAKTLLLHYPKLVIQSDPQKVVLDLSLLTATETEDLVIDLRFLYENPGVDRENICCKLSNYQPQNSGQETMLSSALQLLNYTKPNPAGLFLEGEAGIGKTHVSIGLAKEFIKRGDNVYFYRSPALLDSERLSRANVVIVDDVNNGFECPNQFSAIVDHIHRTGGRLFVTSNAKFDTLMHELFSDHAAKEIKYLSRARGMFKCIEIQGLSQRRNSPWFSDETLSDAPTLLKGEFVPKGVDEVNAFKAACRLVNYRGERASGLYLFGNNQVAKDQLLNEMLIAFEQQGRSTFVTTGELSVAIDFNRMEQSDVIVIKNFDNPFGCSDRLIKAVQAAHKSGAALIITSTGDYETTVVNYGLISHTRERARYDDRMRAMFQICKLP